MAAFNPQTQDTGLPDLTSVSRGTGANRTFETLFSGLTDTAQNVMQVKDTANQLDIRDEADEMFSQVNKEFGVDAPSGLTDGLDQMQVLQNAFEQGKLSEVNYYGRLATLSKQLRARHPGYESVVDSTIQSVTGTRPANAYRDAILSQISQAQSAASNEEKFQRQYVKENEGVISTLYPDYFENPGKYSFDQVQIGVSKYKSKEEQIGMRTKELQLMASENQFNDVQAKKTVDQDFSFITQSFLTSATNANDPSFEQRINEFTARGGGTPQETDQFISLISQAETTLRQRLYQRGQINYVSHGILSNDDLNKAIDNAMYPLTQAKEAVLGGDFKLASRYATLNKVIEDKQVNDLFNDPDIKIGVGLTKINQDLGREWFIDPQRKLDIFGRVNDSKSQQIADEVAGRMMNGDTSILSKTVDQGDSGLTKAALNSSFSALTDQRVTPESVHNIVQSTFGPQAKDWLDRRVVDPADMETLYTRFLDPRVTKAIYEKGTDEDKRIYRDWAFTKARSIPAFSAAAGDINSLNAGLKDWNSQIQLQFDPKSMRVSVVAPAGLDPQEVARVWKPYGRAVDAMNKVFSVMAPIIDAEGGDREEAAREFVRSLSIDLDGVNPSAEGPAAQEKKGFFSWMYEGLSKPLGQAIEETGARRPTFQGDDQELPEIPEDNGEIDFVENEDYDVLDEDSFGQTPSLLRPVGELMSDEARNETRRNLGLGELVSSRKRGYTPDLGNLRPEVVSGLTALQKSWGRELPIVSGYRDPERNRKAGGAKRSQHMHGNAVDIDVSDLSIPERKELIKKARAMGFNGIGVYPNSLHIDKGKKRSWGPNYHNTSLPKWAREVL